MGVIKRGILGGFSGKVANVIGGEWKGIAYMRSQPLSVANPRTAGQVSQRTKFGAVVTLASSILASIVKPLWDRFAQRQSGFNAFISTNIDAYSSAGIPDLPNIVMSRGSLLGAVNMAQTSPNPNTMTVSWDDNSGQANALGTDVAYAIALNLDGSLGGVASGAIRSDGTIDIPIPDSGGNLERVYLSFRRADGSIVSDSVNISAVGG